jgi:hypothetical protein
MHQPSGLDVLTRKSTAASRVLENHSEQVTSQRLFHGPATCSFVCTLTLLVPSLTHEYHVFTCLTPKLGMEFSSDVYAQLRGELLGQHTETQFYVLLLTDFPFE